MNFGQSTWTVISDVHAEKMIGRTGMDFVIGVALPNNQIQIRRRIGIANIVVLSNILNANAEGGHNHIALMQAGSAEQITFLPKQNTVRWRGLEIAEADFFNSFGKQ